MNRQKIEIFTLAIIALVALFSVVFKLLGGPLSSMFPWTNIALAVGFLAYMGYSITSFQSFDNKIGLLEDDLKATNEKLEETQRELQEEKKVHEATRERLAETEASLRESEEVRHALEKTAHKNEG